MLVETSAIRIGAKCISARQPGLIVKRDRCGKESGRWHSEGAPEELEPLVRHQLMGAHPAPEYPEGPLREHGDPLSGWLWNCLGNPPW